MGLSDTRRAASRLSALWKPMSMNQRLDGRFVQDEGWQRAAEQ